MDQKRGFFRIGPGWNWADPSGYGVPGKPIMQDQFYTADVFQMLVPDDGLTPANESGWQPDRLQRPRRDVDPSMVINPPYAGDPKMSRLPPTDMAQNSFCEDWQRVQKAIATTRNLENALQKKRSELASARSADERAILQSEIQRYEDGLMQWRPEYERALSCTTSA